MKKIWNVMTIICICLSIIAIIIGSVAISMCCSNDKDILGYAQVGLRHFFDDEIVAIKFDGRQANPEVYGDYDNLNVAKEIQDLIANGVFQKTKVKKGPSNAPIIANGFTITLISAKNQQYIFTPQGGTQVLMIKVGEEVGYYNSNITSDLAKILDKVFDDMANKLNIEH